MDQEDRKEITDHKGYFPHFLMGGYFPHFPPPPLTFAPMGQKQVYQSKVLEQPLLNILLQLVLWWICDFQ